MCILYNKLKISFLINFPYVDLYPKAKLNCSFHGIKNIRSIYY